MLIPVQWLVIRLIILLTPGQKTFCSYPINLPCVYRKVSTLAHILLELDCEDYTFLGQAVEEFEHVLKSIFMDSVDTLKLDASFGKFDTIASSAVSAS